MHKAGYILCTTPRSGSTMFCQMLSSAEGMGDPHSYFRREDLKDWAQDWGVSSSGLPGTDHPTSDFLEAVLAAGRRGTPVFGLRLMHESLAELLTYLRRLSADEASDRGCLEAAFGPLIFVYLERDDTVSQAISLLRAEQSGLWHKAHDGADFERLKPIRPEGYDSDVLHHHVLDLRAQKAGRLDWFEAERIAPLHVSYSALCDDPAGVLTQVSARLGVRPPGTGAGRVQTARMRDSLSAEWKTRYERDLEASFGQ